jgi:phage protein D
MLTVQYEITIGATQFKSDGKSRLIALRCESSLTVPIHHCRLMISLPKDATFKEDNAVRIQLGYDNELKLVFTGKVKMIEWHLGWVCVEAQSSFRALAKLRTHAYFEQITAADIAKGLADEANVMMARSEPGVQFAFYAVGNQQTAWLYIRQLATLSGFDFYANAEDKMVFAAQNTQNTPLKLEFGKDLLQYQLQTPQSSSVGVEVFGESPASFGQGADASSWLTKKEVKGSSGNGSPVTRYIVAAARTQQVATDMAKAFAQLAKPKKMGNLTLLGNAAILLGSKVEISKMPVDIQNGVYKVTGVSHKLDKNIGFITQLSIEQA